MNVLDLPQGSAEWLQARAGRVTASRIADVLSRSRDKKSEGSMRRNYKAQVACEILTGRPMADTGFKSKAMEAGVEREPDAATAYEVSSGEFVDTVGLVLHPDTPRAAASPDRLVGTEGLLQIKCPYPATHIDTLLGEPIANEYLLQMQWEMVCTGRKWCDFASFNPDFPSAKQLHVQRIARDEKRILEITAEVTQFNREVDELVQKLGGAPASEFLDRLFKKGA